jgi:transposase
VDLTATEGIDEATALVVLSEVGIDLTKFPTAKHFASWLGLCPNHRGAAQALRLAAPGCQHAKNALGGFDRRIQARCGGPKAVAATAWQSAERVWRRLRSGPDDVRRGEAEYQAQYRRKLERHLAKRATALGSKRVPAAAPA